MAATGFDTGCERRSGRCIRVAIRDAVMPDLWRGDVGRPPLEAESPGAGLQVQEQTEGARWPGVRGGDLAAPRGAADPAAGPRITPSRPPGTARRRPTSHRHSTIYRSEAGSARSWCAPQRTHL